MVKYNNKTHEYIMERPGTIKLGDVINFDTGEVERTLKGLNIEFETEDLSDAEDSDAISYDNTSEGFSFNANVDSAVNVGGVLSFKKADSIFIRTQGIKISRITLESQYQLGVEILKRHSTDDWPKNWCVVTELRYAQKAIIVSSKANNASIEIELIGNKSNSPIGINQLIDCKIKFGSEKEIAHKLSFDGTKYKSVAYKVKGINKKWWGSKTFGLRSAGKCKSVDGNEDANDFLMDFNPDSCK